MAGHGVVTRQEKTVIGNLREVAKRLALGRACISVVSDHGFVKTGSSLDLFQESYGRRMNNRTC